MFWDIYYIEFHICWCLNTYPDQKSNIYDFGNEWVTES